MAAQFATIGHSDRDIDEFLCMLHAARIGMVIDVRRFPRSRSNPAYNADQLPDDLARVQIGYRHWPAFGGRRSRQRGVEERTNALWRVKSFHNYADYAMSDNFAVALSELESLGQSQRVALMCAEAVWWRCHRRIIADYLLFAWPSCRSSDGAGPGRSRQAHAGSADYRTRTAHLSGSRPGGRIAGQELTIHRVGGRAIGEDYRKMSRYLILIVVLALAATSTVLALTVEPAIGWLLVLLLPLVFLGLHDLVQRQHAIWRNYPITGHMRFLLETFRAEIRQYFIEGERDRLPFSLEQRSLVYRRAKQVNDAQPFGTIHDMDAPGAMWMPHAIQPAIIPDCDFRVMIGGPDCRQPYLASVLNISGTSFGSFGARAIMAFNHGAKLGGFAHNTGEGSISSHHRVHGGDLIWQVASGYFGCRTPEGEFDPERFRQQAADPQVRMIEIKLSQGAKPGHGGVLPKAKLTPEIGAARGVELDRDCISPARHSAFSSPLELMRFVDRLRTLSEGKPVGFKLAIGYRHEFMGIVKAMLETGIAPDFIVIDGSEGGTGAAPVELTNHVGMPVADGLSFAHAILTGAGLRDRVRLAASGKAISAFDLCRFHALGADYVMAARAFMFSIGCIQARMCHTNRCPTGITTQDPLRQKAIDVAEKAQRVAAFHGNTMHAMAELLAASGLGHPGDLRPHHIHVRARDGQILRGEPRFIQMAQGTLLNGSVPDPYRQDWECAQAASFTAGLQ